MDSVDRLCNLLERMLLDSTAEPTDLPLPFLKSITNNFSDDQRIGSGGFAVVYKGLVGNSTVAVKKLSQTLEVMDENKFAQEIDSLMRVKHKNIVRFLGYCADTQGKVWIHEGRNVIAEERQRLFCFEFLPKGSFDKYISDASTGLEWRTRYKIIKGTCDGLQHLHQQNIVHLDLKPANILLDYYMVPKIADFGLSKCFGENQTRTITSKLFGSQGYMAPEFYSGVITLKSDIYSLGIIIIEILTGHKGYPEIENVLDSWSTRLEVSGGDTQLEQVRVCLEIGIQCIDPNPKNRPVMCRIIERLDEMECTNGFVETGTSFKSHSKKGPIELGQCTSKMPGEINSERNFKVLEKNESHPSGEIEQWKQTKYLQVPKEKCQEVPIWWDQIPKEGYIEESRFLSSDILGRPYQLQFAGAVLLAVTKAGSIFKDGFLRNFTSENKLSAKFHQIRMKLTLMSDTIDQIGTAYLTDELVNNWIAEVRRVAYGVEDVVDKYLYYCFLILQTGFLDLMRLPDDAFNLGEITDELAEIEERINQAIQMKDNCLHRAQLVTNHQQLAEFERQRTEDRFPELFKDEDIVGIEENRKLLTGWLHSEELDSAVITVSGMGGLGKSTLVRNVFECEKVNFPVHAWIVVSQICPADFLLRKLLWKIGNMIPPVPSEIEKMDLHDLKAEIKKKVQNRKCLIILDDVWEQEVYFKIHDAFQNHQASRIIITTRKDHVGAIASLDHQLKLEPLDGPDAFDLFCRRAFHNKKDHKCPEELEEIVKPIVDRCQGLPLAIVTIGSLFSSRPQINIWNQTYNQLRSELSTNDHVRAILNRSYHDLSGELRNCFLYCSLFPEDYSMSRESLVRLWVAEGFVLSKEKNTPEEVAEGNLMELIHHNMLEVVDYDELGRVSTCKMHGILWDLAQSVAKDEKFGSANDYEAIIQVDPHVRRLALCRWKVNTTLSLKVKFPHLRSFVANGMISDTPDMLSSILSESMHLTVLELQGSNITELPQIIGNLFNVRYIGLRRTNIKTLPESIKKLLNLHTLDIKQTKIEKLPRGIVKIKKLRHLLADKLSDEQQSDFECFIGVEAPDKLLNLGVRTLHTEQASIGVEAPKGLSDLEELQTLETVQASKNLAKQLKKLMQLRSLWIDNVSAADCAKLFATLSTMPLLSSLHISARDVNEILCLQALDPISTTLHRLIVRGQWASGTLNYPIFRNHGKHLKYLALSWCQLGEDPLGVLASHVPNLTFLSLNRVRSSNSLVLSAGCFPHMKTLVLRQMPDVKLLEIGAGALPCIEGLHIISLVELDKVPQGLESLVTLKKLWLLNLHKEFRTQWHANGMLQKMQHVRELRV